MTNKVREALLTATEGLSHSVAFHSAVDARRDALLDRLAEHLYGVACVLEELDLIDYNAATRRLSLTQTSVVNRHQTHCDCGRLLPRSDN